jgi:hypothetical protein
MIYIKLRQPQKTLIVALTLLGASSMLLPSGSLKAQAQSSLVEASTAISTQLPISRRSMPCQAVAQSPLNNSASLTQQPKHQSAVQLVLAQRDISDQDALSGNSRNSAGTRAQTDPSDQGAPRGGTRRPAGTRGGCPQVDIPLTALVPISKPTSAQSQSSNALKTASDSKLGLTVAEHPSFWFYVPYSFTPSRRIEFVLQDEQGNDVYQTSFTESGISPGVIGFQLPSTVPALEVNKVYRWYFLVYCKPEEPIFVEGLVQRVALNSSMRNQLAQAKPDEKVALYAKADMWYEAVASLAELRRQNPSDIILKDEWVKLLKSMNLDAIAQEPITSMLTPKK